MEDAHTAELQLDEGKPAANSFFAVYDGHGGAWFFSTSRAGCAISTSLIIQSIVLTKTGASVAKYAGTNVYKRLVGEQTYKDGNYQEGLRRAFLGTDDDILKSDVPVPELNGFL